MNYQYIPYIWFSVFALAVSICLIVYTWKNINVRGALPFLLTMILIALWIVAQAFEFAAVDLSIKLALANIQYLSIMYAPVTYLILTIYFTGRERWLTQKWFLPLLLLIPVVMQIFLWTNDWHSLIRQNVYLNTSGPFPVVGKTFGPVFWGFAVYNFSVNILSLGILAEAIWHRFMLYRQQVILLFVGLLLPVLSTFLHVSGWMTLGYDLTPVVLGFSGLLIFWGIFRYHLFDVIPVARSTIIEGMQTGVIVLDRDCRIVDVNPAAMQLIGRVSSQLIGQPAAEVFSKHPGLLRLFNEETTASCEMVLDDHGYPRYYEISFAPLADALGGTIGWLILAYNITKRKEAEDLAWHLAFHDNLTGLLNRQFFLELSSKGLVQATRNKELLVVAFIDLDGFKLINDTLGQEAGDVFLCEVGARLKGTLRSSDLVARLGGDEFALLLPFKNEGDIDVLMQKVFQSFEQPVCLQDDQFRKINASIGISIFPQNGDDIKTLLHKAEYAMYYAKKRGKNHYCNYYEIEKEIEKTWDSSSTH